MEDGGRSAREGDASARDDPVAQTRDLQPEQAGGAGRWSVHGSGAQVGEIKCSVLCTVSLSKSYLTLKLYVSFPHYSV